MKTDPETAEELADLCWELLRDVEENTKPDVDLLRRQLVERGYRTLRRIELISPNTRARWEQDNES